MLYGFVRILMTVALRLFYRRIYVTGLENIADKGPVIIMPNHNSSLMDAALLGILIKRPLHFFARGDVFVNGFVEKLLARFHMLPVHPHDGGRKTLGDNSASFSQAEKILLDGGIIIFFPEGLSHTDKQLKPLRKGIFRLAFATSAQRNFDLNIPLIPAGITYGDPIKWRSDVLVHLGAPIQLRDHVENYKTSPAATLLQLSKEGFVAMEKHVPNITISSLNDITVSSVEIVMNEFRYFTSSWRQATRKRLEKEKEVYEKISQLDSLSLNKFSQVLQEYFAHLQKLKLNDASVSKHFSYTVADFIFLILSLPFFIVGYLLNALPIIIARRIAVTKVKRDDFFSWIFVTAATVLYLIWFVTTVLVATFLWWQAGLVLILLMPLSGGISLLFIRNFMRLLQYLKLRSLNTAQISQLQGRRNKILSVVD